MANSLSPYQQFAKTSLLRWHGSKHFAQHEMLPRMSWHPYNLFNIVQRSTIYQPEAWALGRSKITTQRNIAKRLVMGYHAQHVTAKQLRFKYLRLPPTHRIKAFKSERSDDPVIKGFAPQRRFPEKAAVPYHTLLFAEVERRLDTVLFRSCLVPSIYEARTLIHKGYVRVEGSIVRTPGFAMEPGMMFSVEPRHLRFRAFKEWKDGFYHTEEVGLTLPPTIDPRAPKLEKDLWQEDQIIASGQSLSDHRLLQVSGAGQAATPEVPSNDAVEPVVAELSEEAAAEADSGAEEAQSDSAPAADDSPGAREFRANQQRWRALTTEEAKAVEEHKRNGELRFKLPNWAAPMVFMPAYLEVNFKACAGIYVRHPTAKPGVSEIPSPWNAETGDIFQLFLEYWRPLLKKHRVRPVLPKGMKRNVFKRETDRQRDIGKGDALAIEHIGHLRRAMRASDEAYISEASGGEREERAARVQRIRNLRQQRYIGNRLATEALPDEKAQSLPPNRRTLIR